MAEKDRNQRMKEITERLEQGVKDIFTSEMYANYLRTMSQFHSYSFNNTLLIHLQKPEASLVAGYQTWQKKFHRQVRRGEKGIQIIAPAPIRTREEIEKVDPATMEPVLKPDGTPEMEEVEYTIPRFRVTTVFDVSQTEGEPLPELETPELLGSVENYEIFMQAIRDISPVPIRFDEIESGAKGYYSSVDKEIVIQESMSESQTMKTGIHEVTHAKLHDRDIMEKMDEKKDQMTREVEAESVAYTVCQYFGLDTSDYSFPYIAGWSSDKDMKELRSSMDTIRRVSGEFIDQMMNRMQAIRREAQRHQENALFEEPQDRYGIYQLREDGDGAAYRFMGMAYLQAEGMAVDGADYQFVYGDELQEGDTLETLYTKFNMDHPADYTGHSLSVSDVVILKKDGELTAHYVDSFGYQELPEFVQQRQKIQEIQAEQKTYPPLYLSDLSYASEHENADAYLDSRKLNLDCKQAIEASIGSHFDGYHLEQNAAADVVETYGVERVSFVLVCTVQHLRSDGRFSKGTKEWADGFIIPENFSRGMDLNADYIVTSHPAVLDGFIDLARKEMGDQEREKEKPVEQINPQTKGLLVEGHFGTWHTAEEREIAGETFFRMEHDEYGDTVAGIIINADGKLVAEDLEHGFDTGAMEAITEYLYEKVPEPFIKQFYVVNDAYGITTEPEYQFFHTLDEAISAYHQLPNHLEKHLGMESAEPVPSRMTLLKCRNGIDQLEDIEKSSLSGKWINQEVAQAQRKVELYLDNRDTEVAYCLGDVQRYFFIQTGTEGYDYTIYDAGFKEIDGGIFDNMDVSMEEAVTQILDDYGLAQKRREVIDCENFLDKVQEAEVTHETIQMAKPSFQNPRILAEELDQFQYDNDFYEYQDQVENRETHIKEIEELICDGKTNVIQGWLQNYIEENNDQENILRAEQLLRKIQQMPAGIEDVPPIEEAKITFYAAECMEFPVLGEYHDNLTLADAYEKYRAIPSERIHGIKGIGFRLEDGSMYDGEYELMRGGVISKDMIDLIPHYKESPLVQKAVSDLETMLLMDRQEEAEKHQSVGRKIDTGEKNRQPVKQKTGTKQSVLQALKERQERIKSQNQKTLQKTEKKTQGRKKGEPEL